VRAAEMLSETTNIEVKICTGESERWREMVSTIEVLSESSGLT
jgi:hypothetical protein